MNGSRLPLDVLGVILDTFIGENSKESTDDLKACALVCHGLTSRVQKHIFAKIELKTGIPCAALSSLFDHSPHLATYVKELHIVNRKYYYSRDSTLFDENSMYLASIISSASNVHAIWFFNDIMATSFQDLPGVLRTALLERCRTVTGIKFRGLFDLPILQIVSCEQLKCLAISTPHGKTHDIASISSTDTLASNATQATKCRLERLSVDHTSCLRPLLDGAESKHILTALTATDLSLQSITTLLRPSQQSLVRLKIIGFTPISSPAPNREFVIPSQFELGYPALKHIYLHVTFDVHSHLSFIASLLECGASSPPRALQTAVVHIYAKEQNGLLAQNESDAWGRIDAALSHPHYEHFTEIEVTILPGFYMYYSDRDALKSAILRQLPLLSQDEKVSFKYNTSREFATRG
ncbi:hypothetical protein C0991_006962 [Blastosporella zonata]|nr:hypothetical protein C0991_006962 [Blastosporella zonata]